MTESARHPRDSVTHRCSLCPSAAPDPQPFASPSVSPGLLERKARSDKDSEKFLRGLSCRTERPPPLVMSSEAQRSRDIWPRMFRSLIWEPASRREDSWPGRWTLAQTADTARSQPDLSTAARSTSLRAGSSASGRDDKKGAWRPPVEMTMRAHELILIRMIRRVASGRPQGGEE
jgi:hypothetical protein